MFFTKSIKNYLLLYWFKQSIILDNFSKHTKKDFQSIFWPSLSLCCKYFGSYSMILNPFTNIPWYTILHYATLGWSLKIVRIFWINPKMALRNIIQTIKIIYSKIALCFLPMAHLCIFTNFSLNYHLHTSYRQTLFSTKHWIFTIWVYAWLSLVWMILTFWTRQ